MGACQGRVRGECAYSPLSEDTLLLLGKVDRHVVRVSGRVSKTVIAECYSTFLAARESSTLESQSGMHVGKLLAKLASRSTTSLLEFTMITLRPGHRLDSCG